MKQILCLFLTMVVLQGALHNLSEQALSLELENSRSVWLVYRSKLAENIETFERVADVLNGFFKAAYVQSDEDSLKLYADDRANPIDYSGSIDQEDIVSFVLEQLDQLLVVRSQEAKALKDLQQFQEKEKERANKEWSDELELRKKSNTVLLDVQSWESAFLKSRDPFLVNFYEANNSACVGLNKEWQLVSTELKGKVKVAKINMTQGNNHRLEDQVKLSRYPSIHFYRDGPKKVSEYSLYEGVHKKFSILEWVNERLSDKVETADIPTLNKQNFQTLCKTTKNTCIIVFLDGSEPSDTLSQIQKLALDNLKKPITFLLSRKGEQDAYAKQVGVSSYPDTVMVYSKLKKVYQMGSLNFQAISDTIEEISLGNRIGFVRLPITEEIV